MLTLYLGNKRYSSWSLRPWLIVKKANLDFTEIMVSLQNPSHDGVFQHELPSHRVPTLVCESGLKIWDSLAIAEYLAELQPSLLPEDAAARAICRSVSAEMHSSFQTLRTQRPMNLGWLGDMRRPQVISPELQHDLERIFDIWLDCKNRFGQAGPWLFGRFSVADAMFAPVALRFAVYGVTQPGVVADYLHHWLADPDLQQWIKQAQAEIETIPRYEIYPD